METQDPVRRTEWMAYALHRIKALVDRPRQEMTDDQLSIYTFATNALAGGDPVIAFFDRGPGRRLCRVCGSEWGPGMQADHVSGRPTQPGTDLEQNLEQEGS